MNKVNPSDSELKIVIPTYRRETIKQQVAYSMIPDEFKDRTYFLIRQECHEKMLKVFPDANYLLIPEGSVVCLSDTRQWAVEHAGFDKQWQFDDDVKLFGKRDENYRIRGKISASEFAELYQLVSDKLDEYAYVGLAARLFNNLNKNQFSENYACYTCFAFRADILKQANARYDELLIRNPKCTIAEDKWMVSDLLHKGYKNVVLNEWVYDQKEGEVGVTSGDLGGCYGHKTHESNAIAVEEFRKSFPGCVMTRNQKLRDKEGNVLDTYDYPIVKWKKLYEIGASRDQSLMNHFS